jgi:hypothetical protein
MITSPDRIVASMPGLNNRYLKLCFDVVEGSNITSVAERMPAQMKFGLEQVEVDSAMRFAIAVMLS